MADKKYKILFSFTSPTVDVIEVKRLGLPKSTPPSQVYSWCALWEGEKLEILNFVHMDDQDPENQLRIFKDSKLCFNFTQAQYFARDQKYDLVQGYQEGSIKILDQAFNV